MTINPTTAITKQTGHTMPTTLPLDTTSQAVTCETDSNEKPTGNIQDPTSKGRTMSSGRTADTDIGTTGNTTENYDVEPMPEMETPQDFDTRA